MLTRGQWKRVGSDDDEVGVKQEKKKDRRHQPLRPRSRHVIRLFAVAEKRERTVPSRSARQGQNRPAVVIRPDWPSDVAGNYVRSIVEAITGQYSMQGVDL
jgi:hypothetical protein